MTSKTSKIGGFLGSLLRVFLGPKKGQKRPKIEVSKNTVAKKCRERRATGLRQQNWPKACIDFRKIDPGFGFSGEAALGNTNNK